jgi:hypothetical protein
VLGIQRLTEGVGFEPTDPCGSPVFKTGALNRSAIPPIFTGLDSSPVLIWQRVATFSLLPFVASFFIECEHERMGTRQLRILPYTGKRAYQYYIDGLKVNGKRQRLFFQRRKVGEGEAHRSNKEDA